MTRVLMVASEATPFAKTGGLADVVGSLPTALRSLGDDVAVVLPRHGGIAVDGAHRVYDSLPVWLDGRRYDTAIYEALAGVPHYFVDCAELFDRPGLYGDADGDFPDNHIRFAVFSRAALGIIRYLHRPQVIHCHDWQSAMVPTYIRTIFARDPTFIGIKILFTIHNLGYQGLFPKAVLREIGLDESVFHPEGIEFFGKVNFLKGGLVYSVALNTVSKGYAREIQTQEYGFGLDGLLRARSSVLHGILNGVDYAQWSPETDPFIPAHYSLEDLSGKRLCKRDLLREFGLSEEAMEKPLIGIVSRFTSQKGFDLIEEIADELGAEDVYLVALGTGDARYEKMFTDLMAAYPQRIGVRIGYDNPLAHRIEAGADIFLMPSRYEPGGLSQMYSLRYGTVPVVRATGGLDDTIEEGTGFKFVQYSGKALLNTIRQALLAYADRDRWTEMMRRGMQKDFSWGASAAEYSNLYARLAEQAAAD